MRVNDLRARQARLGERGDVFDNLTEGDCTMVARARDRGAHDGVAAERLLASDRLTIEYCEDAKFQVADSEFG
jgi:hypothetical protein